MKCSAEKTFRFYRVCSPFASGPFIPNVGEWLAIFHFIKSICFKPSETADKNKRLGRMKQLRGGIWRDNGCRIHTSWGNEIWFGVWVTKRWVQSVDLTEIFSNRSRSDRWLDGYHSTVAQRDPSHLPLLGTEVSWFPILAGFPLKTWSQQRARVRYRSHLGRAHDY